MGLAQYSWPSFAILLALVPVFIGDAWGNQEPARIHVALYSDQQSTVFQKVIDSVRIARHMTVTLDIEGDLTVSNFLQDSAQSANAKTKKEFTINGAKIVATSKRSVTQAQIAPKLGLVAEQLESDGRSGRAA